LALILSHFSAAANCWLVHHIFITKWTTCGAFMFGKYQIVLFVELQIHSKHIHKRMRDFRFSQRQVWRWQPSGIVPCSLKVDQCFRGVYCFHHQGNHASLWWRRQYTPLKCRSTSMRLHGAISQKVVIYMHKNSYNKKWRISLPYIQNNSFGCSGIHLTPVLTSVIPPTQNHTLDQHLYLDWYDQAP
jgi:hypothetical protein